METLKSIFDATFVHMTVGFLGMLVAAFVVAGAAGYSAQQHTTGAQTVGSTVTR